MPDMAIAWIAITIVLGIGYMMGWLTRDYAPAKGEIILAPEGPHKCKGMPRATQWYPGTQWQCNTCKDVWEIQDLYDGIGHSREWTRK